MVIISENLVKIDYLNSLIRHIGKPIVIVGIEGSGKTTIGRRVARKLGLKFVDSDNLIENSENLSIVEIYDFKGEEYLRLKEAEMIKHLNMSEPFILSTGGKAFLNQEIRELFKQRFISIWLLADMNAVYERVLRRHTRPELNKVDDKRTFLEILMKERCDIYSEANILVKTKNFDIPVAVHLFVNALLEYLKFHH